MSIEVLDAKPLPTQQLEDHLMDAFKTALFCDIAFSVYLSRINQFETKLGEPFNSAARQVSSIVRRAVFSAYTAILDYGGNNLLKYYAQEALDFSRNFVRGEFPIGSLPTIKDGSALREVGTLMQEFQKRPQ